jgi:hypothetical protein
METIEIVFSILSVLSGIYIVYDAYVDRGL